MHSCRQRLFSLIRQKTGHLSKSFFVRHGNFLPDEKFRNMMLAPGMRSGLPDQPTFRKPMKADMPDRLSIFLF
ncbi:MAG: hypothetical protein DRH37_06910 [Deltaproteobacteria bacterium]|nr:MAG: hypothetical protein DRH37_06910 [Deltaproteobacteria bacterium]